MVFDFLHFPCQNFVLSEQLSNIINVNLAAKTVSSFHFKSTVSSMKQTLPEPQNNTVFFQQRRFSPPEDEVRRVAVLPEPPEVLRPAPSHGLNHVAGDAHGGRQGEPVRVATELETGMEKRQYCKNLKIFFFAGDRLHFLVVENHNIWSLSFAFNFLFRLI